MQITKQDGIKNKAGIYKINFSNGMFYIGCTKHFLIRIQQHTWAIKSKFKHSLQAKCFLQFEGMDLDAHFEILQEVEIKGVKKFDVKPLLLDIEKLHIIRNNNDKNLINKLK